jgi:hypothetical protein
MLEHENMHAQINAPKEDLLFCYPADKRSKPGVISSMYPAYRQLAYVLKDTICQKAETTLLSQATWSTSCVLLILTPFALLIILILFGKRFTTESLRDGHLLMPLIFTGSSCLLLESIGLILCLDDS